MNLRDWVWPAFVLGPVFGLLFAWTLTAALRRWAGHIDTARRRAEALLGHLPIALVALDAQGRVAASNACAEELWGAPLPRGLSWSHLLRRHPWLDTEGVRLTPSEMPLLATLASGRFVAGTGLIARAGGPPLLVAARAVPFPGPGGQVGALCSFEPVIAAVPAADTKPAVRLEAEAPRGPRGSGAPVPATLVLVEMWDALPDPVLLLTEDDQVAAGARVVGINEAARRLLGLAAQADALCPAADLLARLQLRKVGGEPLAPAEWLPIQALAGASLREESLLFSRVAGTDLPLVGRVSPFTSAATGRRYVIWLPRSAGPGGAAADTAAAAAAVSSAAAGQHSPLSAPERERPASM